MTDSNFDMDLAIEQGCDEAQKFIDQLRKNRQNNMGDVRLLDAFLRQIPIPSKPDRPTGELPLKGLGLGVQPALHTPTNPKANPSNVASSAASVSSPSSLPTNAERNCSAREAIGQSQCPSAINKGNLRAVANASIQGSTTATKVQPENLVIAPPNTIIKATTKTYLKKHPIESSQLSYNEIKEVSVGKEYKVLKYSEAVLERSPKNETVKHGSSQIPQSGIELIKQSEGYEKKLADGRVQAYPDPGTKGWNLPTIGYGTTVYPDGRTMKRGDIITKAQAEEYLIDHVDKKCRRALEKIPTWKQMNDNQRGALYSFAYNMGEGFYRGSNFTSITKVCDSPQLWKDKAWIEQQFVKYNKSNRRTMNGLTTRRKAEAKLFCTPSSTTTVNNKSNVSQYSEAMNGHCLVELDYGQGTWYIWPNHWDLPWEDPKEHQETHSGFVGTNVQSTAQSFGNLDLGNDLASRIIKYMKTKGYKVFTSPREYNIVYVEGMNPNGTLNDDRPNSFNDVRMIIEFTDDKPEIVGCWEATTEPGNKYTYSPQNPNGAARIKFGQYQAWIVAWHPMPKSSKSHEALFQTQPIEVYRDSNKDFQRSGDMVQKGIFGINQHWGYDLPKDSIGGASAGCLVGRTQQGHKEFMALLKQDKRYLSDHRYVFYTTVIPGDDLLKLDKS